MITRTLVVVGASVAITIALFLWGKTMDGKGDTDKKDSSK